ncbi:MAG: aminoglycoside phosphotransferase family protein [Alphaproteobacteria bacterium]|nr:aminoglycoside phosphotransferase family protein [Alphaproteobacteria bacterium]
MNDTSPEAAPLDEEMIATSLQRMGVIGANDRPRCRPMEGGVSSEIWLVDIAGRRLCIKRALPRLRVEQVWEAPTTRNHHEFAWFRVAGRINPDAAPRLIGQDFAHGLFAMEYLDPSMYPVWKNQLRDGNVDLATAAAVGSRLAQIHGATAGDPEIARNFATDETFYALRIEPYLIATSRRHPDLAGPLARLAHAVARRHVALVHGDVSPKNILVGRRGPVFLDAECAWYGDPAFDLAFCLNHLLLKCMWNTRVVGRLLLAFSRLASTYLEAVNWEPREDIDKRAAHLLPGLLLARVDGKSPVEYITAEGDKDRVRQVGRALLLEPVDRLEVVREVWAGSQWGQVA